MSTESAIGILYCVGAWTCLACKAVMAHRLRRYDVPEELITVFVWPVLLVLWLVHRARTRRR